MPSYKSSLIAIALILVVSPRLVRSPLGTGAAFNKCIRELKIYCGESSNPQPIDCARGIIQKWTDTDRNIPEMEYHNTLRQHMIPGRIKKQYDFCKDELSALNLNISKYQSEAAIAVCLNDLWEFSQQSIIRDIFHYAVHKTCYPNGIYVHINIQCRYIKHIADNTELNGPQRRLVRNQANLNIIRIEENKNDDAEQHAIATENDVQEGVIKLDQPRESNDDEVDQFPNETEINIVSPIVPQPSASPNETSSESNMDPQNMANDFQSHLASWATEENISLKAIDCLLKILKTQGGHKYLPSSSRTLLETPRITITKPVGEDGSYWHCGLQLGLFIFLEKSKKFHLMNESIDLMFNIDGLSLSNSSFNEIWPILGSIFKTNYVFVIGIYHSYVKKPVDIDAYLDSFIQEVNSLIENGFTYQGKCLQVKVNCFCANGPAKASMLCIKEHSGYNSCTKCNVIGSYKERRTCFPDVIGEKRTNQSFLEHIDHQYHLKDQNGMLVQSPLENIIDFGMVSNVPLDYQHLLCFGMVRELISAWWTGELHHRIPLKHKKLVSFKLLRIRNNTPNEFHRKPRPFNYYLQFNATEFREILLYTGVFALKHCLPEDKYNNFLALHVASTILCSPDLLNIHLNYARKLLQHFVTSFRILYGSYMVSHNVHNLLHLSDDAEKFGPLDNFSCFKFENCMMQIKKLVFTSNQPLQQIARRIKEVTQNATHDFEYPICNNIICSGINTNGPILHGCELPAYKKLKFRNFIIIAGDIKNNCCSVNEGKTIVRVENIMMYNNCHMIIGYEYTMKQNLYSIPGLASSVLNIFEVGSLSTILKMWPAVSIKHKLYTYETRPIPNGIWAVFPILHTREN